MIVLQIFKDKKFFLQILTYNKKKKKNGGEIFYYEIKLN